jgi:replicative DNA helicase
MSDNGLTAEKSLFALLTDVSSMEYLILEGFRAEYLPTSDTRFILDWAIDEFMRTGNVYAPTPAMFEATDAPEHKKSLADVLLDNGIDVHETSQQPIEWCVLELKADWLRRTATVAHRDMGTNLNESMSEDMQRVYMGDVSKLVDVGVQLETRRTAVEMVSEAENILTRYEARKADQGFRGLTLGLQELDDFTGGIHEDELAVIAAPQKTGKSYFLDLIALRELEKGHSVALCTLENGIDMTIDRIACLATGIHPSRMTRGQLTPEEEDGLATWVHDEFSQMKDQLWILKPPQGERTAQLIVSKARTRKVDALLVDQLLWMESVDTRIPMNQQIRERVTTLKTMGESSARPMPIILAHQVNRDGIERARKANRLWPNDMAEGAAVEQTPDWIFSMWQSDDMKTVGQILWQTLGSRREEFRNFDLYWNVETGVLRFMNETSLP